jgi:hypothetical protein
LVFFSHKNLLSSHIKHHWLGRQLLLENRDKRFFLTKKIS